MFVGRVIWASRRVLRTRRRAVRSSPSSPSAISARPLPSLSRASRPIRLKTYKVFKDLIGLIRSLIRSLIRNLIRHEARARSGAPARAMEADAPKPNCGAHLWCAWQSAKGLERTARRHKKSTDFGAFFVAARPKIYAYTA
jgi:hypothetical protein